MLSLRRLAITLLWLAPVFSVRGDAQSTADELNAELLKKTFLLRPLCFEVPLNFNGQGELGAKCDAVPFTMGMVQIDGIDLKSTGLDLRGHRIGLLFKDGHPQPYNLARVLPPSEKSKVAIHVAPPASGDYGPALDRIFSKTFIEMYADVPEFWHAYFLQNLVPNGWEPKDYIAPPAVVLAGPNGGTTFPKVIRQVDANYSLYAKNAQFTGSVTVSLVVGTDGRPSQIQVSHAAGMGLDEEAVSAVSQYRFQPATKNGAAIPVKTAVEVNFRVF